MYKTRLLAQACRSSRYWLMCLQNFGQEWTNLTEKAGGKVAAFWDFDWGASLTHTDPSKSIDDEVIFATVYEEASAMKGPYPGWDKDLHFVRSDDLWDSQHTKLVACGNQFEVVGQRVSVPYTPKFVDSTAGHMTSHDKHVNLEQSRWHGES